MTTYAEVRTEFKAILNRRDCTDALADGFLQSAMTRAQRFLRVPSGERSVEVTLADATYFTNGYLAIPNDFLKLRALTITGTSGAERSLKRRPLEYVLSQVAYGTQGTTTFFARRGGGLVLAPQPLADEVVRVDYWSEFEEMDDPDDSTVLSDVAKDLLIYGGLSYACDKWNDKRGDRFEQRFVQITGDLQQQADDDELTEAQVQPASPFPSDD